MLHISRKSAWFLEVNRGNFPFLFRRLCASRKIKPPCDNNTNVPISNHYLIQLLLVPEERFFCVEIHSVIWGSLQHMGATEKHTIEMVVQVALLGHNSCKWPFILKVKLLTSVCRKHINYFKLLFKNLISDFIFLCCKS